MEAISFWWLFCQLVLDSTDFCRFSLEISLKTQCSSQTKLIYLHVFVFYVVSFRSRYDVYGISFSIFFDVHGLASLIFFSFSLCRIICLHVQSNFLTALNCSINILIVCRNSIFALDNSLVFHPSASDCIWQVRLRCVCLFAHRNQWTLIRMFESNILSVSFSFRFSIRKAWSPTITLSNLDFWFNIC